MSGREGDRMGEGGVGYKMGLAIEEAVSLSDRGGRAPRGWARRWWG